MDDQTSTRVVLLLAIVVLIFSSQSRGPKPINYEFFKEQLNAGNIKTVTFEGRDGSGSGRLGETMTLQPGESLLAVSGGVSFSETPASTIVTPVLFPIPTNTSDFGVALVNVAGMVVDEVHFAALSSGTYGEGGLGGALRSQPR